MKFKRPRGTSDFLGTTVDLWQQVEEIVIRSIRSYGYTEIRTPIFETTDLFVRAVGEGTDIVTKEMYTFTDKKGRSMTLRPENTAPVMRAYLENGLYRRGGVAKFYYLGPMFRYDRPQAGRYRQFHQIGAEAIGTSNPAVDAEIIDMSLNVYRVLGFPPLEVSLNSVGCRICRPKFKDILKKRLVDLKERLCKNCQERAIINPLRIFDCKDCVEVKKELPVITDHLCDECDDHFDRLKQILHKIGIMYSLDPLLVRGLDYYTKTAYEILHPHLGAQNALCGGGRYDGLAEECGGSFVPAVGFSAGMERLIETLPDTFITGIQGRSIDVYFVVLESSGSVEALTLARELREGGLVVDVDLSGRSLKRQMRAASESGSTFAVIIGPDELEREEVAVKRLLTGEQKGVPFQNLMAYIKGGLLP